MPDFELNFVLVKLLKYQPDKAEIYYSMSKETLRKYDRYTQHYGHPCQSFMNHPKFILKAVVMR